MKEELGKLIVLESLDSGGKSTQIKIIKKYVEDKGLTVKCIHFPMYGYSEFSEMVSKFLIGEYGDNNDVDPVFVSNIYAMDQYMYKNQLLKDLKEFDIVLVDRYVLSNVAYQSAKVDGYNERNDMIDNIINFQFDFLKLPYPDLMLFFDVPIKEIEKRLNNNRIGDDRDYLNGKSDIHEKDITFQNKVRHMYLLLATSIENLLVIPTCDVDEVMFSTDELFGKYEKYLNI